MRTAFAAGLLALLALPAPAPALAQDASAAESPTDEELRAAWKRLSTDERRAVVEWARAEVEHLGTFQVQLVRHVLSTQDVDPGLWPALEEPPFYDAKEHAPAQPIARKRLGESSAAARKLRERVFGRVPERKLRSAWSYDYAARELRRGPDADDPERLFENLLAGFPPGLDLAEALVEMRLDDGAEREVLTAFSHAYADRAGNAAPGITLYDAWCSGISMEMPDVECLGIVHDVLGDRRTWKAPVPASQHDALYARIEELFQPAHRHRGLRHALARAYLIADPVMRDGYSPHVERFHAVWDSVSSDPAKLAEALPSSAEWSGWLEGWIERLKTDRALLEKGQVRQATLAADQARVREVLVSVMRRSGAWHRTNARPSASRRHAARPSPSKPARTRACAACAGRAASRPARPASRPAARSGAASPPARAADRAAPPACRGRRPPARGR